MIDTYLAVAVLVSVALFGYLITLGNERQRKELVHLREQIEGWAVEDLVLKRAGLTSQVEAPEPRAWFSKIVSTAVGRKVQFASYRLLASPQAVLCHDGEDAFLLCQASPQMLKQDYAQKANRLSGVSEHPLVPYPKRTRAVKLSPLTMGSVFDLELSPVWKKVTGEAPLSNHLWLYWIPSKR